MYIITLCPAIFTHSSSETIDRTDPFWLPCRKLPSTYKPGTPTHETRRMVKPITRKGGYVDMAASIVQRGWEGLGSARRLVTTASRSWLRLLAIIVVGRFLHLRILSHHSAVIVISLAG